MNRSRLIKLISVGGLFTSLTVLFQSAPVFLPVIGLAFSPFSTLPVAIAAIKNIYLGVAVFCSSAFLVFMVSPQESMILLSSTGLLGIVLGSLLHRRRTLVSIPASSLALTMGMIVLTHIAGVPAFVEFAEGIPFPVTLGVFLIFSVVYVIVWFLFLHKFEKYIYRINLIE